MNDKILKATHPGTLKLGDINLPCAVLEDGTRILSEHGVTTAMKSRSGAAKRHKKKAQTEGRAPLPVFMASNNLNPFISDELYIGLTEPIRYRIGRRIAHGYKAVLLPQICEVWLKARDAGVLNNQQLSKCSQAEILMRGLAHVGIIALVDEATGYQAEREHDELQKILSAYISDALMPWTRRFPPEFYREMFRLKKWPYPVSIMKGAPRGPRYAGKLTKKLVYEQLPPGVLQELESKNPPNEKGQRKYKHHQWLTGDIGNPHLERQVAVITTLMKVSPNWKNFERSFKRAFSHEPEQMEWIEEDE